MSGVLFDYQKRQLRLYFKEEPNEWERDYKFLYKHARRQSVKFWQSENKRLFYKELARVFARKIQMQNSKKPL